MSAAGLSSERMLKLMAYADGELEGAERDEVEGWLAADVDAVRFSDEIAGLGELVKEGHRGSSDAKAVAAFDVVDLVMAKVERAEVASLDAARARRKKNVKVGAVAAALALAASVFLMTRGKQEAPIARAPTPPAPSVETKEPGVDVDVVESAGESVRVFYLSSETSATTSVVVWVDESGGE